ncbi:sodium/glucose cotransporter 4-like isoform X2 [Lytechinus variegatus]|uniref:sodium/glucose cotransporter 4-like isoform X2 n=1 Tax=Lytechinus variegatus TaxID=7654 RepID=UPI001BB26C63|nr:sodium/glucose cotransporter 4-like isoform X2 [Lytechinus variegatus]
MEQSRLLPWDVVVLVLYFFAILTIGIASLWKSNRSTAEGYFLAGGSMLWLPVGASLFASNIGSEHFIGLAGSGAYAGIAIAAFELNALVMLQLLGWIFLPVYLASGVYTMPEYLQKRFRSTRIRMYLAILSLVIYIFTKISVDLFSGALFIQQALGWDLYPAIFGLLGITAIYTVTGGLVAVIYTETLQTSIMIGGAVWLCIASFQKIGGYAMLEPLYAEAIPNETLYRNDSCGMPREDFFHMLRAPVGSDTPWPGFMFGQNFVALWYWATDQVIVQRALSAKNLSHGQGATLLAGFLKTLPLFLIVMPGMIARIFYTGAHGLLSAVILSALMSSLTSTFNSSSTIFTMDLWRWIRKIPGDREMGQLPREIARKHELELMIVGRLFVALIIIISILWVPVVQNNPSGQLFVYIQQVMAYLAPSITAVFLSAVLWEGTTEQGAFWGLLLGLVLGVIRISLVVAFPEPLCGEVDSRPPFVAAILVNYMYFAMMLFIWTISWVIIISLFTERIPSQYLYRLTFWTRFSREEHQDEVSLREESRQGSCKVKEEEKNLLREDEMESSIDGTVLSDQEAEKSDEESPLIENSEMSRWRRGWNWFCGLSSQGGALTDEEVRQRETRQMNKVIQDRRDRYILNSIAVLVLGLDIFLYAYYA